MSKTALITGASSGIGATFARHLASQGFNLILIARREERLRALADEIGNKSSVEVEVLAADLSLPACVEGVEQRIAAAQELEVLVNNAGFGIQGRFDKTSVERHVEMIEVHVVASVRLARAALPGMIARGRGAIINVSSVAGFIPLPGSGPYSATKAFLNVFSEALHAELRGTGVKIQALCPGFTITEFHDTPDFQKQDARAGIPRFLWLSADEVVAESLRSLHSSSVYCIPGFKYRLIAAAGRVGLAAFFVNVFNSWFRKRKSL